MADYSSDGILLDGLYDPDAQATVTDYIDYTELLPADLVRSLTLIRGLDQRYLGSTQSIHELTKIFGKLPNIPADVRPSAQVLRRDISRQLDRALDARESAYAETCRLYDMVDNHFNRLRSIMEKLHALPRPSTDPPPARQTASTRTSKRGDASAPPTTRITLRVDGPVKEKLAHKSRPQRSLGLRCLASLNPDSPIASTEHSDDGEVSKPESSQLSADGEVPIASARKTDGQGKRRSVAAPAAPTPTMSTSSALALLKPPSDDAKPGSPDMPWLRLTEWEMTILRRKMKKNSVWQPSEVMIHRELAIRGRGWEAYRTSKEAAERKGEEFVDCDDIMNTYTSGQLTRRNGWMDDSGPLTETKLSNRGMRLNEAKRLKRETLAREQAVAAVEAGQCKRTGGPGNSMDQVTALATSNGRSVRTIRKRKAREDSAVAASAYIGTVVDTGSRMSTKRQKSGREGKPDAVVETIGSSGIKRSPRQSSSPAATRRTSTRVASIVASLQLHAPSAKSESTPALPATRSPSRQLSGALLPENLATISKDLRRKSSTPARKTPVTEAAPSRRRKRPAPGPVSSGESGGAAVSYGRRKAKPAKKNTSMSHGQDVEESVGHDYRIDEDGVYEEIDPNEPRYCICGDVSFGTMICCENPDCDREWFHLGCVGLSDVPSRTAKWYCPDCRVKFNKRADGIVRTGQRR